MKPWGMHTYYVIHLGGWETPDPFADDDYTWGVNHQCNTTMVIAVAGALQNLTE